MSLISNVRFEQQPPANLRKSNFFHFICRLFDAHDQAIQIVSANCIGFIENHQGTKVIRNGVRYKLKLLSVEGVETDDFINVIIVDSENNQIVQYEGQDRNPSMMRVLLTHESVCSRCAAKKSCGNKNDTPADPVIHNNSLLKIFLKCNQNCLINAGNPRELRKFMLAVSGTTDLSSNVWAYSSPIFVHNNSKHGRLSKTKPVSDKSNEPNISIIWPQPGPVGGGRALVVGKNFTVDTQVLFGANALHSKVITPEAIQIDVPPSTLRHVVTVTLLQRNQLYQNGWHYTYAPGPYSSEFNLSFSPLTLSSASPTVINSSRISKPFSHYRTQIPPEHINSFSNMLGINCSRPHTAVSPTPVSRASPTTHSPTYPPPPFKPLAKPATPSEGTSAEDISTLDGTQKPAKAEEMFTISKEGSAFNRVIREGIISDIDDEEQKELNSKIEAATILQSLRTSTRILRSSRKDK